MANIYITEQGSILRKVGDRLIVQKDNRILLDVQCNKIDSILIFGNVQFTTQSVHELFRYNIELALLTLNGRLIGQLTPPMPKNIELRMKQYERYNDKDFVLKISKNILEGKLKNSVGVLNHLVLNYPEIIIENEINYLKKLIQDIQNKSHLQELMGIEGSSAKIYFNCFKRFINEKFKFYKRKRRPATDPVNSLLSFGYTLIFNEISSILDGIGFDPYIGFLHNIDYGRPSLAADLVEEFRAPVIDFFTIKLIKNNIFSLEDFYLDPISGSVHLRKEKMKNYFEEYEKYINHEFYLNERAVRTTFRNCFKGQLYNLAKSIVNKEEYKPFIYYKSIL